MQADTGKERYRGCPATVVHLLTPTSGQERERRQVASVRREDNRTIAMCCFQQFTIKVHFTHTNHTAMSLRLSSSLELYTPQFDQASNKVQKERERERKRTKAHVQVHCCEREFAANLHVQPSVWWRKNGHKA